MVNPERCLLMGLVEVDETEVPLRSKHEPIANHGIPNVGILQVIGAVEIDEDGIPTGCRWSRWRRWRLVPARTSAPSWSGT